MGYRSVFRTGRKYAKFFFGFGQLFLNCFLINGSAIVVLCKEKALKRSREKNVEDRDRFRLFITHRRKKKKLQNVIRMQRIMQTSQKISHYNE